MSRKSAHQTRTPSHTNEESLFLRTLYYSLMKWSTVPEKEIVPELQGEMRLRAETMGLSITLSSGIQGPSYTDVVLGLYVLLTRSYVERSIQNIIWGALGHCTNHQFAKFIRLTNARHNPNSESRTRAMMALYEIASTGRSRWLNVGKSWQRGARWRMSELINSGRFEAPIYW